MGFNPRVCACNVYTVALFVFILRVKKLLCFYEIFINVLVILLK